MFIYIIVVHFQILFSKADFLNNSVSSDILSRMRVGLILKQFHETWYTLLFNEAEQIRGVRPKKKKKIEIMGQSNNIYHHYIRAESYSRRGC